MADQFAPLNFADLNPLRPVGLKIFLSHSSKDMDAVDYVRAQLTSNGFEVYVAVQDPRPGVSVSDKIERRIAESDVVVVLLTRNGWDANWVKHEIGLARGMHRRIMPIVDGAIDRSELSVLGDMEYIKLDLADPATGLEQATEQLTPELRRLKDGKTDNRDGTVLLMVVLAIVAGFALSASKTA